MTTKKMEIKNSTELELERRIAELERENKLLKEKPFNVVEGDTVRVPPPFKPIFDDAQRVVGSYFKGLKTDPTHGTIEINAQRYVLVRASSLSFDFLNTFKALYADRGEEEAIRIGKTFLFDIAHVIGMDDARNFHKKMNLTDPIQKLSAGPVHFAYAGWAFVDISPESRPSPDENFFLKFNHPYSFEASSWIDANQKSDFPVCIMSAGYSSGWCEQSFGIHLTAVEISCVARGDKACTFIMAPPHKIEQYLSENQANVASHQTIEYEIPAFFQRKKVEEELKTAKLIAEESDRSKSEFLANMSHEIRTPLNAIIGYVDLILKDPLIPSHREYLETVRESGHLLLKLINDILDLSKIGAGQLIVEQVSSSLPQIIKTVEAMSRSLISQNGKNIDLINKFDFNVISENIRVDPTRLKQIFNNLISNSVKFTQHGYIEFGAELKSNNKTIVFYVKDTGIGIPEEKHGRIFEMFGQADTSTTRQYGGSGLGLTITKKLVELMGGKIWLESKVGWGTTFYFELPYAATEITDSLHPIQREKMADSKNSIILLVDDSLLNLQLIRIILERAGFAVLEAKNGREAVEIYEKNPNISLVLMDIQMPVLDGLEATRAIREIELREQRKKIPVIALTANALVEDKRKCIDAGCNYYLTKPIVTDSLIEAINNFV